MNRMGPIISVKQPSLPEFCQVTAAVRALSNAGVEARGAIFTKREIVDFILDLASYTAEKPLYELRLLEPSFGEGDFLLPAIDRLMASWKAAGSSFVTSLAGPVAAEAARTE